MNCMRRMAIRIGTQSETICPEYSIFKLKTFLLSPTPVLDGPSPEKH
jgi:hypothetical protein